MRAGEERPGQGRQVIDLHDFEGVESAAFQAIGVGVYAINQADVVLALNPKGVDLLGWTAEQCEGLSAHDTFHLTGYSTETCPILAVALTGEPAESQADTFRRVDGSLLPVWWSATPICRGDGRESAVVGALVAFADRTAVQEATVADAAADAQVRSDLGTARQAVSDLGWAAELTQALASAPDEQEALNRLTRMAVPKLCEVIVVHRVDDSGRRHLGAVSATPDLDPVVRRHFDPPTQTEGLAPALPHVVTVVAADDVAESALIDPACRALHRELGADAVMIVPLAARGHLVAVAEMIKAPGSSPFGEADRLAAIDLARRVGLAVDNLRLLQVERSAAMVLQEALLPTLADRPGLRLGWRYRPAGDVHRVGGDWYDAFPSPGDPDTTVVVIGDVAGHDLTAATTMAAVRNLLRGIAVSVPTDPAGLLSAVDTHLADLGITTTATVVAATITSPAHSSSDSPWVMRWSNAGHLPPIVVLPDGTVERLDRTPEPLLGTGTAPERTCHTLAIPAGATVVLYTDGLVERADENLDASLDRLETAVRHAADVSGSDPQEIVDFLLQRLLPSSADDTAVFAVHLD